MQPCAPQHLWRINCLTVMRYSLLLTAFAFTASAIFAQQKSSSITSAIEEVTVFSQGAQITRKAQVNVAAGNSEIVFAGLSPSLDAQSIQISGSGAYSLLSVNHMMSVRDEQQLQQDVQQLLLERYQWQQKQTTLRTQLKVLTTEEAMLLKNQEARGQNTGLKAIDLKELIEYHRLRLTEIYARQQELTMASYKVDSVLQKLNAQLSQLNSGSGTRTSEIRVKLHAKTALNTAFTIKYLVKESGWYSSYDLRAGSLSAPLEIGYKATVHQRSGEDWKNVKLTLSTGNPQANGTAPVLQPWYLRYGAATSWSAVPQGGTVITGMVMDAQTGQPLEGVTVQIKGTRIVTIANAGGKFNFVLPQGAQTAVFNSVGYNSTEQSIASNMLVRMSPNMQQMEEVVVTAYSNNLEFGSKELAANVDTRRSKQMSVAAAPAAGQPLEITQTQQPTAISYTVAQPYTILNDGKQYMVEIKTEQVPAQYEYFTAPKVSDAVYLTARIAQWQELQLQDGEINLFVDGAFVGRTVLQTDYAGDTLVISMGQDKRILVQRKRLTEFSGRQFLSNFKTDARAYEIVLRNTKGEPASIVVQDQLPITTNKEITLSDEQFAGGLADAATGIITWRLTLPARQEQKLRLQYKVRYPKEQQLVID